LKSLSPLQFAQLERQLYLQELLEWERAVYGNRLTKLNELWLWLDQNNPRAQASFNNEMRQKQIQAARVQAAAMMLLGACSMVNAYTNWQNSYYNSYQVTGGTRHFQLYDQFGNYYHGTIR
jgi:hypothetical protein